MSDDKVLARASARMWLAPSRAYDQKHGNLFVLVQTHGSGAHVLESIPFSVAEAIGLRDALDTVINAAILSGEVDDLYPRHPGDEDLPDECADPASCGYCGADTSPSTCVYCGRCEGDCSADPCNGVIAERMDAELTERLNRQGEL